MSAPLLDGIGRRIEYLRVSVTDRCNFRCLYCMPVEGLPWLARETLLDDAELVEVVRQLSALGLRRIRISGGEPTLRPGLPALVRRMRGAAALDDVSLSTNGVRLPALARELRDAGVDRVNVSVDTLRADRVAAIARRSLAFDPIVALDAALGAGFEPVKVNVVVLRGVNDDEVAALAALTLRRAVHVRFIELMPVGDSHGAGPEHFVAASEVAERIERELGTLLPAIGPSRGNGPARYHAIAGALGTVGFITPMSHTYCASCNRVRLTADGRLRTCLFGEHEVDLRTPLRAGEALGPHVLAALRDKPAAHELLQLRTGGLAALSQTGG
jgi:cyclic pyranopterin phosphate synthase